MWELIAAMLFLNITSVTTSQRSYSWLEPASSGLIKIQHLSFSELSKTIALSVNSPTLRPPTSVDDIYRFGSPSSNQ